MCLSILRGLPYLFYCSLSQYNNSRLVYNIFTQLVERDEIANAFAIPQFLIDLIVMIRIIYDLQKCINHDFSSNLHTLYLLDKLLLQMV